MAADNTRSSGNFVMALEIKVYLELRHISKHMSDISKMYIDCQKSKIAGPKVKDASKISPTETRTTTFLA